MQSNNDSTTTITIGDLPIGSKVAFGGRIWTIRECDLEDATTLVLDNADYCESNLHQWINGDSPTLADHRSPDLHPVCNVKSDVLVTEDPGGTYKVIIQ